MTDKTEKEDMDYMEINISTQQPPTIYQQLQIDKGSDDVIYDEISVCEQTGAAQYELKQMTSDDVYDNNFTNPKITRKENIKMNPKTDVPLQTSQCSSYADKNETTKFGTTTDEYDIGQMTSDETI